MANKPLFKINKRQKFVLVSILLTFFLLINQLVDLKYRYFLTGGFFVLTYISFILALKEDIKGIEWFTLFILPAFFSTVVSLFYFLLPIRWLTRLPVSFLYGLAIYAFLLSENIFNVAAIRTIQLYQAALTIYSLFSIIVFFLFGNIVYSFHLSSLWNLILFFLFSFTLFIVNFWNLSLESYLEKKIIQISFPFSLVIAQIAFILSFWPSTPLLSSLFLTTLFYLLLIIGQNNFLGKPLGVFIWEYLLFIFTLMTLLSNSRWGG